MSASCLDVPCDTGTDSFSLSILPDTPFTTGQSASWMFMQPLSQDMYASEDSAGTHLSWGPSHHNGNPLPIMSISSDSDMESPCSLLPEEHASDQLVWHDQVEESANSNRAKRKTTSTPEHTDMATNGQAKRARHTTEQQTRLSAAEKDNEDPYALLSTPALDPKCPHRRFTSQDQSALDKHMESHVRPFICVFHYAGCTRTFAKKNEWKRHVLKQHICLEYYHCEHMQCAATMRSATKCRARNLPPRGRIFRRKDLHMQHIRRMHSSDVVDDRQAQENMVELQRRAVRTRCHLPQTMRCPAEHCTLVFSGEKAWDERMEHTARHLWAAHKGLEPQVNFGGAHDTCLSEWAERPDVDVVRRVPGGWELNNPLRDCDEAARNSPGGSGWDEDAEGEPV
jgi:hypothetical protein